MKVLVLVSDRVLPVVTATRVRNHYLWPAVLKQGVEVKVLGINLDRGEDNPQGPLGIDSEFIKHQKSGLLKKTWNVFTKSFHEWPRSEKLVNRVLQVCRDWQPDIVHAEELRMAYYLPGFWGKTDKIKQTITFHNVESELLKMTGSSPFSLGKPVIEYLHQKSFLKYEAKCIERADLCFAFSQVDREKYSNLYPQGKWAETSNGTEALALQPLPQVDQPRLLIVGSLRYAPNLKGLFWFLDHVWPKISQDFHLTVAGSNARPEVRERLAREKLVFVDTPESLTPSYNECALCVVPVFEGSGTRTKILESLALERMVLTTEIGVEGLPLKQDQGVIVADPEQFIEVIRQWGTRPDLRKQPCQQGRKFVIDHYDWTVVAQNLVQAWQRL